MAPHHLVDGSTNWVVIGKPHHSKPDCERAAEMTAIFAKEPRPMEKYHYVIREVKQGA